MLKMQDRPVEEYECNARGIDLRRNFPTNYYPVSYTHLDVYKRQALMIMPGVAFDRANHRVGYGGGFYDRYLEKHPQLERVAIAFSFQMLPEVPTEPTDICPQIIVTEEEICYLTD